MNYFLKVNKNLITYSLILLIVIPIFGINFFISFIGNVLLLLFLIPFLLLLLVILGFNSFKSTINTCNKCGSISLGLNDTCVNCGAKLSRINGIEDIAMTTNGYLLEPKIDSLLEAGLNRITVSLDAIDEITFKKMSDQDFDVNKVLSAIETANKKGFDQIKINCVVQKDVNEHSILDLINYTKGSNNIVRFIEYMDVGNLNGWELSQVVSIKNILEIIEKEYKVKPLEENYQGEVAKRYILEEYSTEFGFISSVSKPFCSTCTRARITMDGKLVTCLFANGGFDLRKPLRDGCSQKELHKIITGVWLNRNDRYSEIRHKLSTKNHKKIEMFQIGG